MNGLSTFFHYLAKLESYHLFFFEKQAVHTSTILHTSDRPTLYLKPQALYVSDTAYVAICQTMR